MNILCLGTTGYAINGAVQVEDGFLISNTNFGQKDLSAATKAMLRLATDEKPLYLQTMNGKMINVANGNLLPINDDKSYGDYKSYKVSSVNIQEMSIGDVSALVDNFFQTSFVLDKINIYTQQLATGDITLDKVNKIVAHFDKIIAGLTITLQGSLTTGGKEQLTISASGIPVPNSLSCTYSVFMNSWSVKFKVMSEV